MFFFYTNPILIAAAVIPAIFLLVHVYRADKLEKEPAPLLISLVLYGIAATFIANLVFDVDILALRPVSVRCSRFVSGISTSTRRSLQ